MLSEVAVCECTNWVAFFVFADLNVTVDLSHLKHAEGFDRCQNVLPGRCGGFRLTTQQTSRPHRRDLCVTGLACLLFPQKSL